MIASLAFRCWARPAHSATTSCSGVELSRRLFRLSERVTKQIKLRPFPASPQPKTAAKIPLAQSRNLSRAKSSHCRLSRPGIRRGSSVGAPSVPTPATGGQPALNQVMPLAVAAPPGSRLNAVASQHALQSGAAGGAAVPDRAPLATAAVSTAEITPPILSDGYAVRSPRSGVKAPLKLLIGRCRRNTLISLATASRSFAGLTWAPPASTIGLLSVRLHRRKKPQGRAAD